MQDKRNSTKNLLQRLESLDKIGLSLSRERDITKILDTILRVAMQMTYAEGGTFYQMTEDDKYLNFKIIKNSKLNLFLDGTQGKEINFHPIPLMNANQRNTTTVAEYCVTKKHTVNIKNLYLEDNFDFSGTLEFDKKNGYTSKSFLSVPMLDHEDNVIGVLQLINAINPQTSEITHFTEEDQRLTESLASQASVVLTNRILTNQLEELFEGFIKIINDAIDEKSPYTGRHCQRVPILTSMLAEATHRTKVGPFADFSMTDRDRYELKISGLLHDCGKVTTPVHVVDKETKLQTIFDRIKLIKAKFEIEKRDATIESLNAKLSERNDYDKKYDDKIDNDLKLTVDRIDRDFKIVEMANIGREKMPDDLMNEIKEIASRYKRSTVDDNFTNSIFTENELENLLITHGTLTKSERDIINNHIVVTIKMLKSLPWPKHLKNVPEFAGGHHERVDGNGYPAGLTKDQLSIQARMMCIADIFEALTARDRPYKRTKSLMEVLIILGELKMGGHIDPDLFDVFIREKVYAEYAKDHLPKEQIDAVDENLIPGYKVT